MMEIINRAFIAGSLLEGPQHPGVARQGLLRPHIVRPSISSENMSLCDVSKKLDTAYSAAGKVDWTQCRRTTTLLTTCESMRTGAKTCICQSFI